MLLAIFSAILLILAFPDFNLSYLAFVGFVPLFFAIQNKSPRKAFLISYISGFLFYLGVLYWLYHVTVIGLIILCLYLALYFGIFALFFNLYAKRCTLYAIFLIPLIWISLEWIKARLFTGFGWSLLGYSQYKNHLLIQVADFSGVYGVSFVIMTVNVAVYKFFRRSLRELVIAGLMLAMVFGYGMMRVNETKEGQDIRVSVIQGNIPQEVKWDPAAADDIIKKYINLTRLVAFQNPDLIIWPETSFPGFFMEDKEETNRVLKMVKEIMIPTLIGANTTRGLDTYNSAVLVSPRGEVEAEYNKIHLVPFGEYVPFSDNLPILHRLVLGELGEFTPGKEYKAFSLQPSVFSRNIKFGTLICFEDIFPSLAREFVRNGARFLVVITNDAWYGKSGAPYQHAACSVFRAIENRVPVVRCANTGYSCFIDSKGRIYDSVSKDGTHLFVTGHKTSVVNLN